MQEVQDITSWMIDEVEAIAEELELDSLMDRLEVEARLESTLDSVIGS